MAKFIQPGKTIDYTAEKKIGYHELIQIGKIVAVARHSAESGEMISCTTEGVFEIDKEGKDIIEQGDQVFFNEGKIAKTGEVVAGIAWAKSGADETTCLVKIN